MTPRKVAARLSRPRPRATARLAACVAVIAAIAFACATGMPVPALADPAACGDLVLTADDGRGLVEDTDYAYADNVLTIKTTDPVTVAMAGVVEGTTIDRIVVDPGEKDDGTDNVAHVTIDGVRIDVSGTYYAAAMLVSSGALELELAGDSSLRSGYYCAGLQNGENPLTISGEGTLSATGGHYGAGIGGGIRGSGSNIAVEGGTVTATGGAFGAGIGGGSRGSGSDIRIGGGTVTARGGNYGAGIGGGSRGSGSDIHIGGGTVTATGGHYGAGIGGGSRGSGSDIHIGGGCIDAIAGVRAQPIGGDSSSNVSITGGCFVDAGAVLADVSDATNRGTVYGIDVPDTSEKEGVDGYAVIKNPDEVTSEQYPVAVVPAKVQADASLALAEGVTFTYDGDPVEADAFTVTDGAEGSDPVFEHRAEGDDAWADGLPTNAGSWLVRATVDLPHAPGYDADDEAFYFDANGVTDELAVAIAKAPQDAPSGLTVEGERAAGGNDGAITGVAPGPAGAEWRPAGSGDDAWADVPEGGTVGGLAPGGYEVRQRGDENHEASPATAVTVPSFSEAHGGISYPDGTAEGEGGLPALPEGGGTVTWPDGTGAELPGGTTVDPGTGAATTPGGTTVAPDGEGSLEVTFPDGSGVTVPSGSEVGDDSVELPDGTVVASGEGGTLDVTFPDGSQATVPGGSEVAGGSVTAPGGTVVAPAGDGSLDITFPDGTEIAAPSGSTVAAGTVVGPDGARVWPVEDEGEKPADEKPADEGPVADEGDALARTSDPTALLAPAALAAAGAGVLLARRRG